MSMDSICNLGSADSSDPYPVHDLFTEASTLFDSYGLVTLDQIIQVANKIYEGTTADELIEIEKDKWFYTCLFNSSDEELQTDFSNLMDITFRWGLVAFKFLIDKVIEEDSKAIWATKLKLSKPIPPRIQVQCF